MPSNSRKKKNNARPEDRIVYQIEESKAGASFQAVCPELVITGFGDTREAAREALRAQIAGYAEDCGPDGHPG